MSNEINSVIFQSGTDEHNDKLDNLGYPYTVACPGIRRGGGGEYLQCFFFGGGGAFQWGAQLRK